MSPLQISLDPARASYVFREVRTRRELTAALAVRYAAYQKIPGLRSVPSLDPQTGYDADEFDPWSRHFALFHRSPAGDAVIGTLRVTSDEPSPLIEVLVALADEQPSIRSRIGRSRPAPLPMLSYLEQAAALRAHYAGLRRRGRRVAEPGRLALAPSFRTGGARACRGLALFMVEAAVAWAWRVARLEHVLLDCDPRLSPLYKRVGFNAIPGIPDTPQTRMGLVFRVMEADPGSLPLGLRARIEDLAREWTERGETKLPADFEERHAKLAVA